MNKNVIKHSKWTVIHLLNTTLNLNTFLSTSAKTTHLIIIIKKKN